jgi:hypothetical protein
VGLPRLAKAHPFPAMRQQMQRGEMIMRATLAAVLVLSVLAGVAGAASAADEDQFARDFWQRQERNLP